MHTKKYTDYLDTFNWESCRAFLVERQLSKNTLCVRVEQLVITFFTIKYPNSFVGYLSPVLKTRLLGAPKDLSKYQRKRWAVEKARELLAARGDQESLEKFAAHRPKQDDVSDCILMGAVVQLLIKERPNHEYCRWLRKKSPG